MRHVPNLLTYVRFALVPLVVWSILGSRLGQALVLFLIAGITDALDGWIARRWNAASRLGALLDPVADKLLLSLTFPALAWGGFLPWWLAWLVIGRDVLILLIAAVIWRFTTLRSFPPSMWGKLSTVIQVSTAVAVMARLPYLAVFFAVTAALTVFSGLDYLRRLSVELRRLSTKALHDSHPSP